MTKDLAFAGVSLRNVYGLRISGSGTYDSPVRAYEAVKIPGRDGDLLLPEKRFDNVVIKYPAFIERNFKENYEGLRAFLLSQVGYQKLADGYHPGEYRMAYFPGAINPQITRDLQAGQFDLNFVCKPQRFLSVGDQAVVLTTSGTYTNPTLYPCKPRIVVTKASGATGAELTVGDTVITLSSWGAMSGFAIDCETMNFVHGTANLINNLVTMNKLDFPEFKPGDNGITFGSGVASVTIYPHIYTI